MTHLTTNLTTRALAALFSTSQSTADRIIHHLVPVPANLLRLNASGPGRAWIIDGTLIPVHDQSITAISKNYRRSVNTQIVIAAQHRTVIAVGRCWPGNRNDVIVAHHTVAHLLDGTRTVLGDGRYRGITTITSPRRGDDGRIIRDNHYQKHRRIRAHVEHIIARLKDWQNLRQCRRRGQAINHSLHNVAGLWNLKTAKQLRVNSLAAFSRLAVYPPGFGLTLRVLRCSAADQMERSTVVVVGRCQRVQQLSQYSSGNSL